MNSKFLTGLYYRFCYVLQHQFSIGCSGRTTTMMIIMSMMKTMSITSEIFNLCCICFAEKHDFSVCNVRRCFNVVFVSSRVGQHVSSSRSPSLSIHNLMRLSKLGNSENLCASYILTFCQFVKPNLKFMFLTIQEKRRIVILGFFGHIYHIKPIKKGKQFFCKKQCSKMALPF